MTNLFRQAKILLDKKDAGAELTEQELRLIHTALIPFTVKTADFFPENITIAEGLEELASMVEEATGDWRSRVEETAPAKKSYPRKAPKKAKRRKQLAAKAR